MIINEVRKHRHRRVHFGAPFGLDALHDISESRLPTYELIMRFAIYNGDLKIYTTLFRCLVFYNLLA